MYKALFALAVCGAMSSPAVAQADAQTQLRAAPPAKPQMVKKIICHRVDDEETTGSRVGSAPKVCKTVEVRATGTGAGSPSPERTAPEPN